VGYVPALDDALTKSNTTAIDCESAAMRNPCACSPGPATTGALATGRCRSPGAKSFTLDAAGGSDWSIRRGASELPAWPSRPARWAGQNTLARNAPARKTGHILRYKRPQNDDLLWWAAVANAV
jgi:hypothetical protein